MIRIIARLDVKPPYVVKPVHFEGLRKVGSPNELAMKYYEQGADEIVYIDIVSSLFQREIQYELIEHTSKGIYVPFAAGGGVSTLDDIKRLLHNGVDKVVMNTHVIHNPKLIEDAAKICGSQAILIQVDAKKRDNWWECYTDCGRIPSGKNVVDWVKNAENNGAGELLISSVDCDGRRRGFDIELIQQVTSRVNIPVIASSGAGKLEHIEQVIREGNPDGVAIGSMLHYDQTNIMAIKHFLREKGIEVTL